jgi:dihydrofolate reductase
MTRDHNLKGDFLTAWSIEEALNLASRSPGGDEVFVIGGSSVYSAAVPLAERIYLTEIDADFDGDTVWVGIDESWWLVSSELRRADHRNFYNFRFVILERQRRG